MYSDSESKETFFVKLELCTKAGNFLHGPMGALGAPFGSSFCFLIASINLQILKLFLAHHEH